MYDGVQCEHTWTPSFEVCLFPISCSWCLDSPLSITVIEVLKLHAHFTLEAGKGLGPHDPWCSGDLFTEERNF